MLPLARVYNYVLAIVLEKLAHLRRRRALVLLLLHGPGLLPERGSFFFNHHRHAPIPALDDHPLAKLELEKFSTVPAGVELLSIWELLEVRNFFVFGRGTVPV